MAGSLNKVMCIGNLGRDPEMRYMPNGNSVTNFSVATSRTWKNAEGENQEETEWFNIVAYGKLGEIANQYLSKGRKVYVEGRLRTRSWDDQTSGEKRYRTEVIAGDIQFLEGRGQSGGDGDFAGSVPEHDTGVDEMPF
ncbi:MAG TPA: single-stranded DNA-binding protein [Chloroflexota bacterium]|nr:single-stranded DNA-binding protein [Chloroflexota bacterium]